MAREQKRDALQLIFSFFLGVLLAVFVGVGVWTFYPDPAGSGTPLDTRQQELFRQQERLNNKNTGALTTEQQTESNRIQDELDKVQKSMEAARSDWSVVTSVILVAFATLLMAISLFLPEAAHTMSNGVLLGGLFSILYGTGWSFAGHNSNARFAVVAAALLLTVLFGYIRFVRGRGERSAAVVAGTAAVAGTAGAAAVEDADATALATLSARVSALESRAQAAAAALRGPGHEED